MSAHARMLKDGRRLHLQHGPIDLIVEADGDCDAVRGAYQRATARFGTILEELVGELDALRRWWTPHSAVPRGCVARRMTDAVAPHWSLGVTPMAAVAGSVADEILSLMCSRSSLERAYVNNGGDIALYLKTGRSFSIASANGKISVQAGDGVGGIATSGWRGRSLSMGIADSVTVLAATAAAADVAATLIANAVDLPGSVKVQRAPAHSVQDDSDLGCRLVTTGVCVLDAPEIDAALARGCRVANRMRTDGQILAATLRLAGQVRIVNRLETQRIAVHA